MEVLELDGKRYVKASKAAREAGYTSDYIGQLCRSGSVDAHLVGRSWYVDVDQLANHRIEKKRNSRVKAREQVRKELEARSVAKSTLTAGDEHFRAHVKAVSYLEDDTDLLPEVRKVSIKSETPPHIKRASKEEESNYEVENEGKHIVHTGTLVITDLGDEDALSGDERDTVLLSPRIQRTIKKKSFEATKTESTRIEDTNLPSINAQAVPRQSSFLEKIEQQNETSAENATQTKSSSNLIPTARKGSATRSSFGFLIYILYFVLFLGALGAPFIESVWSIGADIAVTYAYDIEGTLNKIGF